MLRRATALAVAITIVSAHAAGAAGKDAAPARGAAAGNTQILLFNMTPAASYAVRRNNVASGTVVAAPSGVVAYETNASNGDIFQFLASGITPVTPAAPSGLVATGNSQGCVSASWNTPAASDYVTGYSLLWKTSGSVFTDSVAIASGDIAKGAKWVAGHCGFANGTYTFALRAHNSFDRWSRLSASSTATISNQDTQGPVPPTNVKVTESTPGCASVTWTRSSAPDVTGYRVYVGTRPGTQAAYTDSLDAGNAAAAQRCNLAQGTYYFAVRAYTAVGAMSAFSKEVSLSARGVDTAGPSITQRSPAPGATNVALNSTVFFVATDDKTGVNASSISVKLNDVASPFSTSSVTGGIAVQCDPANDFPANSDVSVAISVADQATPPNVTVRTYSFHTGSSAVVDNTPPATHATSPGNGAGGVDPRPTIEVQLDDAGVGVDIATIVLEINGNAVAFAVEGDPSSVRIRYRPATAFPAESTVDVHVEACDRAQPPHCSTLDYQFSVRAANAALAGNGAIVPDGYWANDAARPLEVRDLPAHWGVHIFDTAGASVRHHVNQNAGATWMWDFRNDAGARVAPALYLVRVTDGSGAVKRSGRFLVQAPR